MTKFLDTIKAFQYNDSITLTKLKQPKMLDLNHQTDQSLDIGHTYRIEATFATQTKTTPDNAEQAVEYARREIAEYVYGEINKELTEWFFGLRCSNDIGYKECEVFYKILDKMR